LGSVDPYSVLDIVDNEDEDRREEVDGMDDREGKIELCRCNGKSMYHNYQISLKDIVKVDVVLVVEPHVVVANYCEIEDHGDYAANEVGLDGVHLVIIGVDKS
jgi:hypothetical protein